MSLEPVENLGKIHKKNVQGVFCWATSKRYSSEVLTVRTSLFRSLMELLSLDASSLNDQSGFKTAWVVHLPEWVCHTQIKSFVAVKVSQILPSPCGLCPEGRRTRVTQWLKTNDEPNVLSIHRYKAKWIFQILQRQTFSFLRPERLSSYSACRSYKGFCKPVTAKKHCHQNDQPSSYCTILKTLNMPTFPRFAILFVSFLLMCLSMLVSPRDIRTACQKVSAPRATPTVLQIMRVQSTINIRQSGLYRFFESNLPYY